MVSDYDKLLSRIGGFGIYQKCIIICICLMYIPMGFFIFSPVFTYRTPPHRCRIPSLDENERNTSADITHLSNYIPFVEGTEGSVLAQCVRYLKKNASRQYFRNNANVTKEEIYLANSTDFKPEEILESEECLDGWVYSNSGRKTATSEFDLVCTSAWKKPLLTSGLMIGLFVGSIISGPAADRYGRRIVCLISLFGNAVLLVGYSFAQSFECLIVLTSVLGIDQMILYSSAFVLAQELVDTEHRAIVACAINVTYIFGYMILPFIAYLFTDWRWMVRSLGIFSVIYFPYFCFLPESSRWLVSKNRNAEALVILRKIARVNKAEEAILRDLNTTEHNGLLVPKESNASERRHSYVVSIATSSVLRKRSIIVCWIWNVCFLSFYTLGLSTSNLGGNDYINCLFSALLEIPCYFIVTFLLQKIGRRTSLALTLGFSGVICGLYPFIKDTIASTAVALIGKLFASGAMGVLFLYTSELYPTMLRNSAVAMASMSSRIFCIAAPFLVFAGENANKYFPFYIMAALLIATTFIVLLLPETRNSSLPESLEDAIYLENFKLFFLRPKGKVKSSTSGKIQSKGAPLIVQ